MNTLFNVPPFDQSPELYKQSPPPPIEPQSPHEGSQQLQDTRKQNKLRAACDACHASKIRCSDGTPCKTCKRQQIKCVRSTSRRQGRPKGIRNKKTTEKEAVAAKASQDASIEGQEDPDSNSLVHSVEDMVAVDFTVPFTSDSDFWNIYVPRSPRASATASSAASPRALLGANDMLMDTSQDDISPLGAWEMDIDRIKLRQERQDLPQLNSHCNVEQNRSETEFDKFSGATNLYPGPMSTHTSSSTPSQKHACTCLQRSAQLVSSLKGLARNQSGSHPTDVVLMHTRNASIAWRQMLQQISCHDNSAEEVIYLSISGIKIALQNLEALFNQQDASDDESFNSMIISGASSGTQSRSTSHSCNDISVTTDSSLNSNQVASQPQSGIMGLPAGTRHCSIPNLSSLGSYTIDPEEQQIIAKIIALRLVCEIQEILQLTKERILSQGGSSSAPSESSDGKFNANRGTFGDESNWHFAAAHEESLMDMLPLLEKTKRSSNMLLHRLRSLSMSNLGKL